MKIDEYIGKDIKNNVLLAGQGFHHPMLYANRVIVEGVNWISPKKFTNAMECMAKFRYRQADNPVIIKWLDETTLEVITNKPVRAITPGQAAVFYDGEVCLGGGTINEVFQNTIKLPY